MVTANISNKYQVLNCSFFLESGCVVSIIRLCFGEEELIDRTSTLPQTSAPRTLYQDAILLGYYFAVLQVSFLTWGILQEKIMTQVCVQGTS